MHMVDLMSSIICEGDTVSQELLDTVLVNLVPAHKVRERPGISVKSLSLSRSCSPKLRAHFVPHNPQFTETPAGHNRYCSVLQETCSDA